MQTEFIDLGFIYDVKKQQQVITKMTEYFKDLTEKYAVRAVLFSLENLDLEKQLVFGTTITGIEIRQEWVTLPRLIYNFALHYTAKKIDSMRNLRKIDGITVVNPINRFIQGMLLEMLATLPAFKQFLLPASPFNESSLADFLAKYPVNFLLPDKTFLQPKAVVLKRLQSKQYSLNIGSNGQICRANLLLEYIRKMTGTKKYILMKGINYLSCDESSLEARVCLQKGTAGKWSVISISAKSGIFTKESYFDRKLDSLLGGKASAKENKHTEQTLSKISLEMCKFLDYYIPFFGSCTLDFVFDEANCPYLIYIGGFEQNPHLFFSMDPVEQIAILDNALHYLLFLQKKNNEKR